MAIDAVGWNLQESLAIRERAPALVEAIKQYDADVIVLSDAFRVENSLDGARAQEVAGAYDAFHQAGYTIREAAYDDDHAVHGRYLTVLSRLAIHATQVVRLGNRNGLSLRVTDRETNAPLHIMGLHFDDRCEAARIKQAHAAMEHVKADEPSVLLGDFNALHQGDRQYAPFRHKLVHRAIQRTPNAWVRMVGGKVAEMASGTTMQLFEQAGLRDVDILHQPTMPARFPMLDLDHGLVSEQVHSRGFEVGGYHRESDHRGIAFTVEV